MSHFYLFLNWKRRLHISDAHAWCRVHAAKSISRHSLGSVITVRSVALFTYSPLIMSSSYICRYWVRHFTQEHWKLFTAKASRYWVKLAHLCFEDQHFHARLHTHNSLRLIAVKVANAVKWGLYFQGDHVTGNISNTVITLWFILDTFFNQLPCT